jgi:molybdopterin synthase sulfur carrier subunit
VHFPEFSVSWILIIGTAMPTVRFTPNLKRFFPTLRPVQVDADNVAALLQQVEALHPGLRAYLVDEHGALRTHVNIFVGDELIHDKTGLSDGLRQDDEVYILQALSGG